MKPLPLADPRRPMPRDAASRRAVAEAAVNTLAAERRRLEGAGEEWALARTAYQLRYWRFVRALVRIIDGPDDPRAARVKGERRAA